MVKSPAFLSLTGKAPHVLLIFQTKLQMALLSRRKAKEQWTIANNGELVFTYEEAQAKYGLSQGQFRRAIDQLVEHGFIDIEEQGSGLYKMPSRYGISERWRAYGSSQFKAASRRKGMPGIGYRGRKRNAPKEPDA